MRLGDVVTASRAVTATASRTEKTRLLAELLVAAEGDEIEILVAFLSGSARQGRIGIGAAAIQAAIPQAAADVPLLSLAEVDAVLEAIAGTRGARSGRQRALLLRSLFERATRDEQEFLTRLLFGELRQGALEGVLTDAVARAAGQPPHRVRRAAMLAGNLGAVARAALELGETGLAAYAIELFRPVQPMLADSAADVEAAVADADHAVVEWKLDGARIQVHKEGNEVRVYSRTLRDVTGAVPEVVELVRTMPPRSAVLDGEAIALRPSGSPHPFQVTMRRFGRRLDVDRERRDLPLTPLFFDCLYVEGGSLLDEPLSRRLDVLHAAAPSGHLVPHVLDPTPDEATRFLQKALAQGHEGVMVKSLASGYAAGRRGSAWLKVKQARTLDLVVLAAEWGSGRRRGWLSNLHLGARDTERGGFVMLGKTFKGLTDETLAWQTQRFLQLETGRDAYTVFVRPELVVEIAFNDLQASPHYPGGLALRFARVKGYRQDKPAAEADTFASVQEIYRDLTGLEPPARRP